ncbi:hypothetical protein J8Z22_02175 [Ferrimonas sp. SCSIO 43195]|nr:hypothetical protein J8Z22_02175 [Ferrimonas sp. SCSIO 43195]
MNTVRSGLALAMGLLLAQPALADVKVQRTSVKVGYDTLLSADKNKNLGDQGYLVVNHMTVSDWGSFIGWFRFENPLDSAENQLGKDLGPATKTWMKLDYGLGESPFNLWLQSFTLAKSTAVEENFYLGLSYDLSYGKLLGTVSMGAQYAYGSFSPTKESFSGISGMATSLMLGYKLTPKLIGKFYYIGQFFRSDDHQNTFGYDSYGHQLITGVEYHVNKRVFVGTSYKHRKSWGGALEAGDELLFEAGYKF